MRGRRTRYDIRREGHPLARGGEDLYTCPGMDMTRGKLFNSDEDRLHVLALLLESVGIDAAVRLGPAHLWQAAVAELRGLEKERSHTDGAQDR